MNGQTVRDTTSYAEVFAAQLAEIAKNIREDRDIREEQCEELAADTQDLDMGD